MNPIDIIAISRRLATARDALRDARLALIAIDGIGTLHRRRKAAELAGAMAMLDAWITDGEADGYGHGIDRLSK
jgi:hypothetical protein